MAVEIPKTGQFSLYYVHLFVFTEVVATADPMVGFKDVDVAILVGAMPRKEGMERKDLLAANVRIFMVQGQAIDKVAKKTVKVRFLFVREFSQQS